MIKQLSLIVMLCIAALLSVQAQDDAFITTWNPGDDGYIVIATHPDYTYNYNIVVKNADTDEVLAEETCTGDATIENLPTDAWVTVEITGTFPAIYMNDAELTDRDKLKSIDQWGSNEWQTMEYAFNVCRYFSYKAVDAPNLSKVTSMRYMFGQALQFNGDLSGWDVSHVTNMSNLFNFCWAFNGDISTWDVGNVTDMNYMFYGATKFNGDISVWDVSNVTNMNYMFFNTIFNGDISNWDVGNVTIMSSMFNRADFDGDISAWDVSNVTTMRWMFRDADFNGDISGWDLSSATNLSEMFYNADNFNQDLSGWDVSHVSTLTGMFQGADAFNGDISGWDVSNVSGMSNMFNGASSFNNDLSSWSAKATVSRTDMFTNTGDTYYTITYNEGDTQYLGFYPAGHQGIELRTLDDKDGNPFYGWNTASDFSGDAINAIEEGNTGDITLYAEWSTPTNTHITQVKPVSYYPNPVINKLNIEGLEGNYISGVVCNTAGAIITQFDLEYNQNVYQIDLSDCSPGIYLLQLKTMNSKTEVFKILKK